MFYAPVANSYRILNINNLRLEHKFCMVILSGAQRHNIIHQWNECIVCNANSIAIPLYAFTFVLLLIINIKIAQFFILPFKCCKMVVLKTMLFISSKKCHLGLTMSHMTSFTITQKRSHANNA